jgi:flagellar biosynthetic protein FlhB
MIDMNQKMMLTLNLQFFAEDSGAGEKTEQPTSRKREKSREEGQVAKSNEITTAFLLISIFYTLKIFGPWAAEQLIIVMREAFTLFKYESMDILLAQQIYLYFVEKMLFVILPILGVSFIVAFVANIAQVGWKPSLKPLKPKLNRLSPIQGFKRMFSMRTLVELLKSILKIAIILLIVYLTLVDFENMIYNFYRLPVFDGYVMIINTVLDMAIKVGMYFIIVATIDFAYQKYKHEKDLKMTKQEVKDERKMIDGNPEIKGKIRQKMREAAMRRMMQDIPKADVVITNPTHFAIAIAYDENQFGAPRVLAKGADLVAARIREQAKEFEVEIVENKLLARTLYYTVEIGQEIPPELYQAVAEVLAFVYSLKNRSALT